MTNVDKPPASMNAFEKSKKRVAELATSYFANRKSWETENREARMKETERCFLSEVENLSTDPDFDASGLELTHAHSIMAGTPILVESTFRSSLLSRIGQSFLLSPEERQVLIGKHFQYQMK